MATLRRVLVLGDGARWIWTAAAEQFGERKAAQCHDGCTPYSMVSLDAQPHAAYDPGERYS